MLGSRWCPRRLQRDVRGVQRTEMPMALTSEVGRVGIPPTVVLHPARFAWQ